MRTKNIFTVNMALTVLSLVLVIGTNAQKNISSKKTVNDSTTNKKKDISIKGIVRDGMNHKPIYGATLQVMGFPSATITDTTGHFTIKVPELTSVLIVESEGFEQNVVPIKYQNNIEIYLQAKTQQSFNDLLATPLGMRYKRFVTSSVEKVEIDGWAQPDGILDSYLQSKVAGLNSIRRSGTQGAGANLFLNGINSLYGTNQPLIVVDGMLFDATDYGQSLIANNYTNPLSLIDLKDVDNVTVLKDASSLYGSKGANGAILVSTVRAKDQATKIDAGIYTGMNFSPKHLPVLGTSDYRTYLSNILNSQGLSSNSIAALPYMNDNPSQPGFYTYHNSTDWQSKVLDNSMNQNVYLRITGGDNIATYGLTVGYMNNKGIIQNTNLERYNTRFNAEFNFSEKFKGSVNLAFTYNNQKLKDQGLAEKTSPLFSSLIKAPFLTDHELDDAGVVSPNLADVDILGVSNPTVLIDKMKETNQYYRFFGSFGFHYDLGKYLGLNTLIGIQYDKVRETYFVPSLGVVKDTLWNDVADNRMGSQVKTLFTLFNDTRLEYNRNFSNLHNVIGRVGVRYQANKSNQVYVTTANSATDDLISVQNGLASLRQVGGDMGRWTWFNTYVGADYSYRDKLFLSVNAAMDGSSRFGVDAKSGVTISGHKFPIFPSISAAWLLSSESFMAKSAISLLKLRASYSITGNDDIGNYTARYGYTSQNLLGTQGNVRNGIPNTKLQWENVNKLNFGADIGLWQDRVNFSVDIYDNKTKNMLVFNTLETITGFATVLTNDGSMSNKGIEVNANVRIVNTRKLKWDFSVNIAKYTNKILSVPNGAVYTNLADATILTQVGKSANLFYGYKTQGVFSTSADAASAGLVMEDYKGFYNSFNAGDVHFVDLNNDKIINENDRTIIGNPNPDFFGGFNNRIIWKRFELNTLFTFSVGNDVFNYLRYRLESQSNTYNQLESVNNAWRFDGQVTSMPKATWGDPLGNSRFSDRWIEDGSYLRLRSVNLTYNVPLKSSAIFKSVAVSITGNNLLTFTKYLGYDPEFSMSSSPLAQGIDTGLDPQFKSLVVGVHISL